MADIAATTVEGPPRIVLHVGTHKTGTTSLQHFLRAERDGLLREADVSYPDGLVLPAAHAELPLLAIRPERLWPARIRFPEVQERRWLDAARAHVREQISQASRGTVLMSHEDLSYLRYDDEIERLRSLLGPRQVTVVVYLRDKREFLRSYREQLEATGFSLSEDPTSYAYCQPDSWLVDYDALVSAYRRHFGADHVEVLDYDQAVRRDGSVIPTFVEWLGIPRSAIPPLDSYFLNRGRSQIRLTDEQLSEIRRRLADQALG